MQIGFAEDDGLQAANRQLPQELDNLVSCEGNVVQKDETSGETEQSVSEINENIVCHISQGSM